MVGDTEMGEYSCPACGAPALDVDEQNSVVYCKNCGFAARVDPQTGQSEVLSPGGGQPAPGGAGRQGAPAVYQPRLFGMDPNTFLLGGTLVFLIAKYLWQWDWFLFVILEVLLFVYWLKGR